MKEKIIRIPFILTALSALVVISLVLFILFSPGFSAVREAVFTKKSLNEPFLKVTYLYVGQGDATVIRDIRPGGKTMLIDAGPSAQVEEEMSRGQLAGTNYAAENIIPYLEKEGVEKIDYMVASHKDGDHIGGMSYIIRNFPVGTVYDNGSRLATEYVLDFYASIKEKKNIVYKVARAGEIIPFGDDITCQVIAPLRSYRGTESDENNYSVVVRIVADNISFIFPGDIEIPAELDLTAYGDKIKTTVFKAPHHGSASSSCAPFIKKLKPEVAIFSCGRYNPYGFPSFEIIRRYEEIKAEIFRTDLNGNIEILTDGEVYKVYTER